MTARRRVEERPGVRWRRQRAWAASILAGGLILFVWPFVRTPPLSIGLSYAHLLGSWALVIAALATMARSLGRREGGDG
jgi:hypothetical protein